MVPTLENLNRIHLLHQLTHIQRCDLTTNTRFAQWSKVLSWNLIVALLQPLQPAIRCSYLFLHNVLDQLYRRNQVPTRCHQEESSHPNYEFARYQQNPCPID